ncbi:MAG TPA: hypothetical protein EYM44_11065 [Gammaproteobacteria bacterium]|nr:hypothetical protein [Gammaproteobacteria bacterium]
MPGLFFFGEPAERSGDGALDGVGQKRCCAAPATALPSMSGQAIAVRCPRPATGVGEMAEAKIVGKNENNIRLVRSA